MSPAHVPDAALQAEVLSKIGEAQSKLAHAGEELASLYVRVEHAELEVAQVLVLLREIRAALTRHQESA